MATEVKAPVLLGLLDEKVDGHVTDWSSSKIGGCMDLMCDSFAHPCCKLCGRSLTLVSQIYCPLADSMYHRVLYIFACSQPKCWNKNESWSVIRAQKLDKTYQKTVNVSDTKMEASEDDWGVDGSDDWGVDGADDWGDGNDNYTKTSEDTPQDSAPPLNSENVEEPCDITNDMGMMSMEDEHESDAKSMPQCIPENPVEIPDYMKDLIRQNKDTTMPTKQQDSDNSLVLDSYFMSVFNEPSDTSDQMNHEKKLLKDYMQREGADIEALIDGGCDAGKGGSESYEKAHSKLKDKAFHKFTKRLSKCPEQILRYSWNGEALPISPLDQEATIPCCAACGGRQVFELQLMPGLVSLLSFPGGPSNVVEFGTVLVYTCESNCWDDNSSHKFEHVVVQPDPDYQLFN